MSELLKREKMARALFEVGAPPHQFWDDVGLDKRELYFCMADAALSQGSGDPAPGTPACGKSDLAGQLRRNADDCENMERWATPELAPLLRRAADAIYPQATEMSADDQAYADLAASGGIFPEFYAPIPVAWQAEWDEGGEHVRQFYPDEDTARKVKWNVASYRVGFTDPVTVTPLYAAPPVRSAPCTLNALSRAAQVAVELRRFHRNSCYPEAMDVEINETIQRISALIQSGPVVEDDNRLLHFTSSAIKEIIEQHVGAYADDDRVHVDIDGIDDAANAIYKVVHDYAVAQALNWQAEISKSLLAVPVPHSAASSATDLLAWLRDETSLELSFERWEEDGRWQVHEIRGGRNDQEWSLLGSGDTPEQALSAAKIALEVRKDAKAATRARHDRGSPAA